MFNVARRHAVAAGLVGVLSVGSSAAAHQEFDPDDGNVGNVEIYFTDDESGGCELFPGREHCGYHQHGVRTVSRVLPDRSEPVHGDGSLLTATVGRRDKLRLIDPHRDETAFQTLEVAGIT
jgi:hypothetical protein